MRAGGMAVGSEEEPELAGAGDTEAGAATVSVVTRNHLPITSHVMSKRRLQFKQNSHIHIVC